MAKILLADDSGTAQRMGAQILSAEGHEVATVSNGQAAFKMLAKFAPDLIVADVFMPGRTGYELCELVKSDPDSAWIPVLLIVAPMEPYDATEGKRVKADGLVTKPLDKSNLVETVQALLASSKRPAASIKRGAKAAAAEPEPPPPPEPAEMHDLPAEEDPTIPAISTTATAEIKIPEEMRDQPVSLVSDMLEPEKIGAEPPAEEEEMVFEPEGIERDLPAEETPADDSPSVSLVENDSPEITQDPLLVSGTDQIEPEGIARIFAEAEKFEQQTPLPDDPDIPADSDEELLDSHEAGETPEANELPATEPEPSAPPNSWTADPVDVAEEDKRLFGSEPPDWQGLVNLVQEADQQGQFPAVSSAAQPPPPAEQSAPADPPETHEPPFRKIQQEPEEAAPPVLEPEPQAESPSPAAAKEAPQDAAPAPPVKAEPAVSSDTISTMVPQIAPLDYATVEQIVRETMEEIMPQIVDRISQATGMQFPKKESPKD